MACNCKLSTDDIARLEELDNSGRIPVRVHLVGAGVSDAIAVRSAVADLGIDLTISVASDDDRFAEWDGRLGVPTFLVKRRGVAVAMLSNIPPESALDVVESLLEQRF